jgi:large subunit ribosomal protein L7Ae
VSFCCCCDYRAAYGLVDSSDKYEEQRRVWGGGLRGNKSTQMLRKRAKAAGQSTTASSFGKL